MIAIPLFAIVAILAILAILAFGQMHDTLPNPRKKALVFFTLFALFILVVVVLSSFYKPYLSSFTQKELTTVDTLIWQNRKDSETYWLQKFSSQQYFIDKASRTAQAHDISFDEALYNEARYITRVNENALKHIDFSKFKDQDNSFVNDLFKTDVNVTKYDSTHTKWLYFADSVGTFAQIEIKNHNHKEDNHMAVHNITILKNNRNCMYTAEKIAPFTILSTTYTGEQSIELLVQRNPVLRNPVVAHWACLMQYYGATWAVIPL